MTRNHPIQTLSNDTTYLLSFTLDKSVSCLSFTKSHRAIPSVAFGVVTESYISIGSDLVCVKTSSHKKTKVDQTSTTLPKGAKLSGKAKKTNISLNQQELQEQHRMPRQNKSTDTSKEESKKTPKLRSNINLIVSTSVRQHNGNLEWYDHQNKKWSKLIRIESKQKPS